MTKPEIIIDDFRKLNISYGPDTFGKASFGCRRAFKTRY